MAFRHAIKDCELIDAGFQGYPFTRQRGDLEERLDRLCCNLDWRLWFAEAAVHHLPKFKSDHRLLLLAFSREQGPNMMKRPFRFFTGWMVHGDFPRFMPDSWRLEDQNWTDHITNFQNVLRDWNKRVYGNVFAKKRRLMRKLKSLDN